MLPSIPTKMILFTTIFFCSIIAMTLSSPIQAATPDYSEFYVPNFTTDGRPKCDFAIRFLSQDEDAGYVARTCDKMVLPYLDDSYFKIVVPLQCFGVYDTIYQLCTVAQNDTKPDTQHHTVYETATFCGNSSLAFEKYYFKHNKPQLNDWATHLRTVMTNLEHCTQMCVFGDKLNPMCRLMVSALELYPKLLTKKAHSKITTKPMMKASEIVPVKNSNPTGSLEHKVSKSAQSTPLAEGAAPKVKEGVPVPSKTAEQQQPIKSPSQDLRDSVDQQPEPPQISSKPIEQSPVLAQQDADEAKKTEAALSDTTSLNNEEDESELANEQPVPELTTSRQSDLTEEQPKATGLEDGENNLTVPGDDSEESNLVTYFILMTGGALLFYIGFHNKNKLLALALEGRRASRRGGRHSSASYSKLHSNLEEAIAAGPMSPSATHVLY